MMRSSVPLIVVGTIALGWLGGLATPVGAAGEDPPAVLRPVRREPGDAARTPARDGPAGPIKRPGPDDVHPNPEAAPAPRPAPSGAAATPGPKHDPDVEQADFLNDTAAVTPPRAVEAGLPFVDTYFDRPDQRLIYPILGSTSFSIEGLVRTFYRNDQRIQWSGLEETFGAESDVRPILWSTQGDWTVSAEGEFFLNMPFGSSILSTPQSDLYRANFHVDTFEVFQLYTQARWGGWRFRLGKARSPFGNFRAPMFSNALFDAPFLRTDVIPFTETGLFARHRGDWLTLDVGLVNGEPNLDTNSSKGFIGRLGIDRPNWSVGISDKSQDGIGSEFQKRRNSIQGVDASLRLGRFVAYSEATIDQYGFNHDFNTRGNPLNLGVRSLYGRDIFVPGGLSGTGYYVGAGYRGPRLLIDLNYGSYQPQRIGVPVQDATIVRFVGKIDFALTRHLHVFALSLIENRRPRQGVLDRYQPWAVQAGFQFLF